jgi:hypothetical protein
MEIDLLKKLLSDRKTLVKFDLLLNKQPNLLKFVEDYSVTNNISTSEALYRIAHDIGSAPVCHHGQNINFTSFTKGYTGCCNSSECKCFSEKIKAGISARTPEHTTEINKKRSATNIEKYGCSTPLSNPLIREKIEKGNIEKYGFKNPMQNSCIKQKASATNMEKYGDSSTLGKNSRIRANINEKLVLNTPDRIKKSQDTLMRRYGEKNPSKLDFVKQKKISTSTVNYGVSHPMQSDAVKNIHRDSLKKFSGRAITNISQLHISDNSMEIYNSFEKFGEIAKGKTVLQIAELLGVSETTVLKKIKLYGLENDVVFYPIISSGHQSILDWLSSINVEYVANTRSVIPPLELDIYLPSYSVAIEFGGIYFHSEISGNKPKHYHQKKYNLCKDKNIKLITVWDCEWDSKQDVIKNLILNKINRSSKQCGARKLSTKIITNDVARQFCETHHLQGYINGINIGLVDDENVLKSVIVMGKTRFEQNGTWEIYRYCSEGSVPGALSKLIAYFCKNYDPSSIITYVDHRFGDGHGYEKIGFSLVSTSVGFNYVDANKKLHNRMNFQKHKLLKLFPNADPLATAWEMMKNNNYDRIWDCGQSKFLLTEEMIHKIKGKI